MKKMVLLVLVVAGLVFVARGQTEYLVTVDPATGVFTKVNSLPGVAWVVYGSGYCTMDESNNTYIFFGAPPAATPIYLYLLDNSNGDIISDTTSSYTGGEFPHGLLYGDSSKILYGIYEMASSDKDNLVSVNIKTGLYPTISSLNDNVQGFTTMTYNRSLNQLIIAGSDSSGNQAIFTVDGTTGNILSETLSNYYYYDLHFDKANKQLYAIAETSSSAYSIGTVNITTGAFSDIYNFPSGNGFTDYTFDERDNEYILRSGSGYYLYFVDVTKGQVIYKDSFEFPVGSTNNVINYVYDNTTNILYALHWEEITMPVTIFSFTATKQGTQNLLQWATTQEVNSSYFAVERSGDGVNFTGIGQVDAAGNSSLAKSYSLVDSKPVNGTDYYRLKMVDKDGKFTYSEVRSINEAVSFVVSIYPNPVINILNLNISSDKAETVEVEVVDNGGKVVAEQEMVVAAGISRESINVGGLSSGEYYVRLVGEEGGVEERFVKGQ